MERAGKDKDAWTKNKQRGRLNLARSRMVLKKVSKCSGSFSKQSQAGTLERENRDSTVSAISNISRKRRGRGEGSKAPPLPELLVGHQDD